MVDTETKPPDARRRILDIAARLFREQGYAAVSLRMIAAEAGMKAGSLYYHFASKEDLVVEILDEGIRTVQAGVDAALAELDGSDPRAVLRGAISAHLGSLLRQSDYTSANVRIFGQVPDAVRERSMAARRDYETLWDGLLARLHREVSGGDPARGKLRFARLMILGALNASLEWFDPTRGSVEALAAQYADLVWDGLERTMRKERS